MYSNFFKVPTEHIQLPHIPSRPVSAPPSVDCPLSAIHSPMMVMTPLGNYILMQPNSCATPQMIPITSAFPLQNPQQFITGYTTTSTSLPQQPILRASASGATSSERYVDPVSAPFSATGHGTNAGDPRFVGGMCATHRRNPTRARCVCSECHMQSARPPPRFSPSRDIFGPQYSDPKQPDISGSYYVVGGEIIFDPPLDLSNVSHSSTPKVPGNSVSRKHQFFSIEESVQTPIDWLKKEAVTATSQTPCAWDGGPAVKHNEPLLYCAGSCPTRTDLGLKTKYRKKWCCDQCKSERKKEKELQKRLEAFEDNNEIVKLPDEQQNV